ILVEDAAHLAWIFSLYFNLRLRRGKVAGVRLLFRSNNAASIDVDPDRSLLNLSRIGAQIDTGRRSQCAPVAHVETPVMLGAFDDIVHHHPACEMSRLVCAESVQRVGIIANAHDGKGPAV